MSGSESSGAVVVHGQGTAAVVPASQTQSHADHSINFGTIAAFAQRTHGMYTALEFISTFLPPGAQASATARLMVAEQRKWLFDVGCTVGGVVGAFYQLEKNTLGELETMWAIGQQDLSVKAMKRNFKSTLENLNVLVETRARVLQKIEECEKLGEKMVVWDKEQQAQKIQHACVDIVSHQFGGAAELQTLIDKLRQKARDIQQAEQQEQQAAREYQQAIGECTDLRCRSLVYRSVAANEQASMEVLQQRAKELQERAVQKGEAAAEMNNTAYRSRGLFFYWTWYSNNSADRADELASKFKRIAKETREFADDQASRSKRAQTELGEIEGKLKPAEDAERRAKARLDERSSALEALRSELQELRKEAADKEKAFGNISLENIALLRDSMQRLPEMLGSSGAQDSGMLEMFKGALQKHELVCKRMQETLLEDEEGELRRMLKTELAPMIAQAISDAHFFADRMAPLKGYLDHQLPSPPQAPALPESSAPSAGGAAAAAAAPPPGTLSLRGDDDLWG